MSSLSHGSLESWGQRSSKSRGVPLNNAPALIWIFDGDAGQGSISRRPSDALVGAGVNPGARTPEEDDERDVNSAPLRTDSRIRGILISSVRVPHN